MSDSEGLVDAPAAEKTRVRSKLSVPSNAPEGRCWLVGHLRAGKMSDVSALDERLCAHLIVLFDFLGRARARLGVMLVALFTAAVSGELLRHGCHNSVREMPRNAARIFEKRTVAKTRRLGEGATCR